MNELPYLVFAGSASQNLAEKICDSLGCPLGKMRTEHFADGEFAVFYEESIRGKDIFLVQSTYPTTSQRSSPTSDGLDRIARTSPVSPSVLS